MSRAKGLESPVLEGISKTNDYQQERFIKRIIASYNGKLKGKKLAIWGLSFKPGTDDLRCAPALRVIDELLAAGASVTAFDPVAGPGVQARYGDKVEIAKKMYDPISGADGLIICTEWREFRNPDFARMGKAMKQKKIFDGRNLYTPATVAEHGFKYASIGRPDA
jgi:UDPglucose 6-dehydrogenase